MNNNGMKLMNMTTAYDYVMQRTYGITSSCPQ